MKVLRTPDERFDGLEGFEYEPHYVKLTDLRVHYLDEGPPDSAPILLLHGEPSWCYLYRKMIPPLVAAGHRVIAPDLVGFGRSDKPTEKADYSYQSHLDWMLALIEALELKEITLFGQDWGGLLGLRLAAENPDRFARLIAGNTFLPTGDMPAGKAFHAWRDATQKWEIFNVGQAIQSGCVAQIAEGVIAGYEAPFPDETYKAGARQFPMLVPITPDDPASDANRKAWEVLNKWDKPFLTVFGDSDAIFRGADQFLQQSIPGAANQPHRVIEGAGHFLQEDKGAEVAEVIRDWLESS